MVREKVYPHGEEPLVEVLYEGRWVGAGSLRMWRRDDAGVWWGTVRFTKPGHGSPTLDAFPADRIRPDETDWSRGRG